jgi:glycosyltransferase involved in cell wall biosynthesis
MKQLAIITTHPIQYYAPWFRYLATSTHLRSKVFYLWNFGTTVQTDPGFQQEIQWDIPLLDGYDYEFIPNTSSDPGTHHFWGLQNPTLLTRVNAFKPDAVLVMAYNYASIYRFLWQWMPICTPLLFRGDSHRLLDENNAKAWIRRQFIKMVFRCFSAHLYVGKANYNYFAYHGVPSDRLFFSPHAVDNDRFFSQISVAQHQAQIWKQELGIPVNHAIILFAGKFEAKKRPLDLLNAFLQASLPNVSLLFVGAGSLEPELRSFAAPHPNIYFAPFQNQSLMPRTYAIADLFVLPSHGRGETWGLAINEAMCMGRPVITSTHVGCTQNLVHPDKNGLVFPAGDVTTLTKCLQAAFADLTQLKSWGEESRRIISAYSYVQTTQGLMDALMHLGILNAGN